MLLKNFIVSLACGVATPTTTSSSNPLFLKTTAGNEYKINSGTMSTIYSASGSTYNNTANGYEASGIGVYKGIVLGTGTTPPPTYNDFKIESPVESSGYSNHSYSVSADCQQVLTQTYTNKSSEDIIVTELGLFVSDDSRAGYPKVLLTRNVISPVTIKPNETKTFTIKIDYNKFSDAYSVS